jgi:hypothetical protein
MRVDENKVKDPIPEEFESRPTTGTRPTRLRLRWQRSADGG